MFSLCFLCILDNKINVLFKVHILFCLMNFIAKSVRHRYWKRRLCMTFYPRGLSLLRVTATILFFHYGDKFDTVQFAHTAHSLFSMDFWTFLIHHQISSHGRKTKWQRAISPVQYRWCPQYLHDVSIITEKHINDYFYLTIYLQCVVFFINL